MLNFIIYFYSLYPSAATIGALGLLDNLPPPTLCTGIDYTGAHFACNANLHYRSAHSRAPTALVFVSDDVPTTG